MAERIENLYNSPTPFLDGPAEFLVKTVAAQFAAVPQFKLLFGTFIDGYKRMDYSFRNTPVVRFYNNACTKTSDNAWLTGDIIADTIFPASVRRNQLQQIQDTVTAAMWQQFRRQPFFYAVRALVPSLNELGRVITVDKSLGYQWQESDEVVPLTQFTINFKLDLRIWDDYIESQDRTTEDPFEKTLQNLEQINLLINAVTGDEPTPVEVELEQDIPV